MNSAVWQILPPKWYVMHQQPHYNINAMANVLFLSPSIFIEEATLPWPVWAHWALSGKPKSRRFNSQSGHMPGLQVQSPVGVRVRGNQSMFFLRINVFLSLSLPFSLDSVKGQEKRRSYIMPFTYASNTVKIKLSKQVDTYLWKVLIITDFFKPGGS